LQAIQAGSIHKTNQMFLDLAAEYQRLSKKSSAAK
jgi:hypothetical protein